MPLEEFGCAKDVGWMKSMSSGNVPLKVSILLLKEPNAFNIAGPLGSIPAGNEVLVYLFIMLSKKAPFCQRNMVSAGWPETSMSRESSLKRLQESNNSVQSLPEMVAPPPCERRTRHACTRL